MIIFGSVRFLSKKVTKPKFFFLKKKTETGSNRPVSVRFGFFRVKTGLARFFQFWLGFFRFWLGFFRFGSVFSVWLGFGSVFPVWLGLARFFFWFFVYKTETEPAGFFKNLIGFFSVRFFRLFFFPVFSV